ncbi:MAG: imidazole glycerol phosphate synthase, glutamine amidotransferase subunit [Chloroflexi bacterium RBG_16_52_11]|nr:MAG: imidazole glycerol phosphate synthase, glutamine amidotransferase subunit [Chloroflexi bacterium RBG_16_52_11]
MITIVNYGLGNIGAFVNIYKRMNIATKIATNANDLLGSTHIILPGVGAFDHAMDLLSASGMREPLEEITQQDKIPILGICVGMQILAESSDEGVATGLGWIKGRVVSFANDPVSSALPTPHMGWNDVKQVRSSVLFKGLETDARFYFLHSFYFLCAESGNAEAHANYGINFACAVQRDNVFGVQFHPEKSHHWGAILLKNFAEV